MDIVALIVLTSLTVAGLIRPTEALSGFSNPAVVTVWAISILSAGLSNTGVAGKIGQRFIRLAGDNESRLLVIIMLTVGVLSGFMNDIGVASLFLPVVVDIARRTKQPPPKLLMPLAFASLLGGLNTLIGTPPNILISEALKEAGLPPFRMFDYTPVGISVLLAGTLFMVVVGRRLLPNRDPEREFNAIRAKDFESFYKLHDRMTILNLPDESTLHGKTLAESRLGSLLGLNVVAVIREGQTQLSPNSNFVLHSGDRLLVEGRLEQLTDLRKTSQLILEKDGFQLDNLISSDVALLEAKLSADSSFVGQTLRQIEFRKYYSVVVLAILRNGTPFRTNLENLPLLGDDRLLIQGRQEHLDLLSNDNNFSITLPASLKDYQLEERFMVVQVPADFALVGKSLQESHLGDAYGLDVLGIIRKGETQLVVSPDEEMQADDTLLVKGKISDLLLLGGIKNIQIESQPLPELGDLESEEVGMTEAVLSPFSTLVGKTLRDLNFRFKYGLSVLAIWREGRIYRSDLRDKPLRLGDALLLFGPRKHLHMLGREPDFLVLTEEAQEPPRLEKIPIALIIMAIVLIPAILDWLPIAISTIIGVVLMIQTKCLNMEEAYRAINWKAIFLIAGMLPLGIAMEQTGAAQFLADGMIGLIGDMGPSVVMAGFFVLAALTSQFMPNPAVAVLLAPIALSIASDLEISPYPLLMAVAVSASAAFLSPVGHSANILVMGPGGYRFSDYLKVGIPLTLVVLAVVLLVMPIFWPF
jgi:di/tricarboxylate transporter